MGSIDEVRNEVVQLLNEAKAANPELYKCLRDDLSEDPYGVEMRKLYSILLMLHKFKDAGYGRSWAKRGEVGMCHNLLRKSDRYDGLSDRLRALDDMSTLHTLESAEGVADVEDSAYMALQVSFIDLLSDINIYCGMWISLIAKQHPECFLKWVETEWCTTTGVPYNDTLVEFLVGDV